MGVKRRILTFGGGRLKERPKRIEIMQRNLDLLTIKCTQCDWILQLQPVRYQNTAQTECLVQACPCCGTDETVIEFLNKAEV